MTRAKGLSGGESLNEFSVERIEANTVTKNSTNETSPHDSNNNQSNSSSSGNGDRKLGSDNSGNLLKTSSSEHQISETTSSVGSTEDWQILDVEDQELPLLKMTSSTSNNPASNNNNELDYNDDKINCDSKKRERAVKYVEARLAGSETNNKSNEQAFMIYLCTAIYSMMPLAAMFTSLSLVLLLFTRFYFVSLLFGAYIVLDRQTCNRGGRRINWIYNSRFWSYLAAYFPIKLKHSTNFKLDPKENYILNYHPHGIAAFGAVTAFATNGLKITKLFPGITSRFMVHETSFVMPIMKETFGTRGDCSVNSRSIDYILSGKHKNHERGNLLTIVVGGLAEADLSDLKTLKVVVAERKGFVKKALIHGANLIPCIAFGENSVFTKVNHEPGSVMDKLESRWYKMFGFKHPVYYGRSLFSDKGKGVMPYKRPITVVMGDPILVQKVESPSQEEINSLHAKYMANLKSLYEDNQDLCSEFDQKLVFV